MQIQMNYFAQFRQAAGVSTSELVLEDQATVLQAISLAADRHGNAFRELILSESDQFQPCVILLVNGIPPSDGIKTILKDGDSVSLFTALAGG